MERTTHNGQPWVVPPGECECPKREEREWLKQHTTSVPPEGVSLRVGDKVIATNGNGVKVYGYRVGGFSTPTPWGQCVHLVGPDCYPYWFPMHPEKLEKV